MKAFGSKALVAKLRAARQYALDLEGSLRYAERRERYLLSAVEELNHQIREAEREILRRPIGPREGMCISCRPQAPSMADLIGTQPSGFTDTPVPRAKPLTREDYRRLAEAGRASREEAQAEIAARRAADLGRAEHWPTWEDFSK